MVVPIIMQGPGQAKQKLQTSPELNGNGVLDGVRVHHPSKFGSNLLFQGSRLSGDFRFHLIAVILAIFLGSGLDAGAGTSLLKATTSVGNSFASTPSTDSAVAKGARASKLRVLVSWLLFGFGKTHVGFCFHWCFLGTEFLKQLEIS